MPSRSTVSPFSAFPGEQEVLLLPGTFLKLNQRVHVPGLGDYGDRYFGTPVAQTPVGLPPYVPDAAVATTVAVMTGEIDTGEMVSADDV